MSATYDDVNTLARLDVAQSLVQLAKILVRGADPSTSAVLASVDEVIGEAKVTRCEPLGIDTAAFDWDSDEIARLLFGMPAGTQWVWEWVRKRIGTVDQVYPVTPPSPFTVAAHGTVEV